MQYGDRPASPMDFWPGEPATVTKDAAVEMVPPGFVMAETVRKPTRAFSRPSSTRTQPVLHVRYVSQPAGFAVPVPPPAMRYR